MSQIIPATVFETSFKHRVEMARTSVNDTKDILLFMVVDGIERGEVTLLGYAIVTEETSIDGDSRAIFTKGKSICEYFDDASLHDVLAKYEKLAEVALAK
jgi:hypothetical protein